MSDKRSKLKIAHREFTSRLLVGTGKFASNELMRDALEATKELVATQGVYTMTPADHSGFDQRGRVLLTVKEGKWLLVPEQ